MRCMFDYILTYLCCVYVCVCACVFVYAVEVRPVWFMNVPCGCARLRGGVLAW